jgi:mycothiol system anti-sigma-R factor
MSCGSPHEMECAEALLRVYEYLDAEMQAEDIDRIRMHLAECGPCLREFGIEEEVKLLVQRSHRCDEAPGTLRDRVLETFQSAGSALGAPGLGQRTPSFGAGGPELGGPPLSLS